jgi:polynucleotide 5'-hydroxyl-kinase GRC3/NOL9
MKQTVEKDKTLLVDGPASVTVATGRVEVFGSIVDSASKIVIREGKRLPFSVEETAVLDISSGENSSIEEVDGNTIPLSWVKSAEVLLNFQTSPLTVVVLGTVDVGKTSFCTYLTNRLLHEKQNVAIIDGDLGQSDIGPPCTVAYTFVTKPITDLFNLKAKNAFFIGVTSPSSDTNKVIEGLSTLKKEVLAKAPASIIIDTDGWIEGEDAAKYKIQLVEKLEPDIIFCIQQKDEMMPILNNLRKFRTATVDSSQAIRQRSREKRKDLRELGYIKYLRNAKVQSFPLAWIKIEENETFGLGKANKNVRRAREIYDLLEMEPLYFAESQDKIRIVIGRKHWISAKNIRKVEELAKKKVVVTQRGEEKGLLVALYDSERRFLGIGVLREVDYFRKSLKILTPVSGEISIVALGKVKLDKNLREIPVFAEENQSEFSKFNELP